MTVPITRKEFCTRLAGGSVVLLFQACGGGGSDYVATPAPAPVPTPTPAPSPSPGLSSCNDTIAANHGHLLTIAVTDLDSLAGKIYDIQGSAAHTHTVTLTVANLQALKAGTTVQVNSSNSPVGPAGAHDHVVSALCV